MNSEDVLLINKIWNYTEEEFNHRRLYLILLTQCEKYWNETPSEYQLTSQDRKELELMTTRASIIPSTEVFFYNNNGSNPYMNDYLFKQRNYVAFGLFGQDL